jgi:anti-anti-sigma factor
MELTSETMGKFTLLRLAGRIDWECAGRLDDEIGRLIDMGNRFIAFDLDGVTFLSSGGIGALAFNTNLIRKKDGAVHLISSNEYVNELFETLKLTLVFEGAWHRTLDDFKTLSLNTAAGGPVQPS